MSETVFERHWTHPKGLGGFKLRADAEHRGVMLATGKGTMEGARASISALDDALAVLAHSPPFSGLVDMRDVTGSPLRAQLLLGHWLHRRRHIFDRIAVFGAAAWERRIGRAVARIARMAEQITFVATEAEGRAFLGWPSDDPPLRWRDGGDGGGGDGARARARARP